ncbi:MAG TPA: TRAP transporter small permease subunit [Syntrophomonadaceae bacterium]|nr:TRAP transporter small permease subunit [Syntrophomonadaceae bacterium]
MAYRKESQIRITAGGSWLKADFPGLREVKWMDKIDKFIDRVDQLSYVIGKFAKYLLFFMALFLFIEVISRYVFNHPTIWVYDTCKQLMCIIGALGGCYALLYNAHVKVDVLYEKFSLRTRAVLDIITSIFFFAFVIALMWKSSIMASNSWLIHERATTLLAPPLYYIKTIIVVGSVLIFFQGIAKLLRDIQTLVTGVDHKGREMEFG